MAFFGNQGERQSAKGAIRRLGLAFAALASGLIILGLAWFYLSPPPEVLGSENGGIERKIASNGRFEFLFSSRMDEAATETAIRFEPEIAGSFAWQSSSVLHFQPNDPLSEGKKITVIIGTEAKDWLNKRLPEEVKFIYEVVSPPKITMVSPISGNSWKNIVNSREGKTEKLIPEAARLKKGQPITIMFDRPIRALSSPSESENDANTLLEFIEFTPEVKGQLAFLGTTALEFTIDEADWPDAREITATIPKGFPAGDGGKTTEEISWTMRTDAPELLSVKAGNAVLAADEANAVFGGENILPDSVIELTFNMPLEIESLFKGMTIEPERKVKSDTVIRDPKHNEIVYLEFDPPLAREETIKITIAENIPPLSGDFPSEKKQEIAFRTLRQPCVKPAGDAGAGSSLSIEPAAAIEIDFCTLMSWFDEKEQKEINQAENVLSHLRISPEIPKEKLSVTCGGSVCQIFTESKPAEELTITFSEGLKDVFGQAIPTKDPILSVRVKDYPPSLSPMTRGGIRGIYDEAEPLAVYFAARNTGNMTFTSCEVPAEIVREKEGKGGFGWNEFACGQGGIGTRFEQVPIPGERNVTAVFEVPVIAGNVKSEAGKVYFWEAVSPQVLDPWEKKPRRFTGLVFPMNSTLTLKYSDDSVTTWATDFADGKPIEGMNVTIFGETGNRVDGGTTNNEGLVTLKKPQTEANFYVEGNKDGLRAAAGSTWNDGIAPWDFGFNYDWRASPAFTGVVFSDRPIYRPGDQVFFKGIVRKDTDAEYTLPDEERLNVRIENSRGEKVYEKPLALDSFGNFSGELKVSTEAPTGQYFIIADTGKESSWEKTVTGAFWVEEYKKPAYEVEIASLKDEYISGEKLDATIETNYFFGAPVKNARVEWHIVKTPLYFDRWSGEGWFSFGTDSEWCWWGCQQAEEVVARGEGNTDAEGKLAISLPIETSAHQLYTLAVTAVDATSQAVSKNITFPVFSGEYVLGVRSTDFWLDRDAPEIHAEVVVSTLEGKPMPGTTFTARLQQVKWNSIKKLDVDGNYYWENSQEFETLATEQGKSGADGKIEITFPLTDDSNYYGELRILAEASDTKGNTVSAADHAFRNREALAFAGKRENNDRISLQLEKTDIRPGEVISILPQSPFIEPVWALISVDRKKTIFQKVTKVSPGEPIEIKSTEEMVPNAFVSVLLSKGKGELGGMYERVISYHEYKAELDVLNEKAEILNKKQESLLQSLNGADDKLRTALQKGITVAQKEFAEVNAKRENLTNKLSVTENAIREVIGNDAEIPAAGVSVPKPEIKAGVSPVRVSPENKRLNVKIESDKPEYFPGEKVSLKIRVKDAYDGPVENADLSVAVVDESLLALKTRQDEDIFAVFFRLRDIGVQYASSLVYLIDRLDIAGAKGTKGGGGGGLDLLKKQRGEFRDTAFWEDSRQTDVTGLAELSFTLPDNVTEWQVWITANTTDSRFGSAKENFFSRKPLIISPVLPRFLVTGDTALIEAKVRNQGEYEIIVSNDFKVENAEVIEGKAESFRVAAGEEKILQYRVRAASTEKDKMGTLKPAVFTFSASGEAENARDNVVMAIPVLYPSIPETIATSGFFPTGENSVTEKVRLPGNILMDQGNISVSLTPGAIGDLTSAFASLTSFPYGCAEQIASSILPDIALSRILSNSKNAPLLQLERTDEEIRANIQGGIESLYELQNTDGGFVFFPGNHISYPYLTAYVLFTLEQAAAADFSVDDRVLVNARAYLRQKVWEDFNAPKKDDPAFPDYDTRAFAGFVLSFSEAFDESILLRLFDMRKELSAEGKAYLLLTALRFDKMENASRIAESLKAELEAEVKQTDRLAFYEAGKNAFSFASDIRSTATVLDALLQLDSNHPLIPKLMNYLRDARQSAGAFAAGPWGSTQNTAWTLLTLMDFLKANPPEAAKSVLSFNQKPIAESELLPGAASKKIEIPIADAKTGIEENAIDITKSGGSASYDLKAEYYLPAATEQATNHGFGIIREFYGYEDRKFEKPLESERQGEIVRAKVTVLVPEARSFVGVKVPLPAGFEAINFALETEDTSLQNKEVICRREWCDGFEDTAFTFKEFRDDHVFFFAEYLPAGRFEITFLARASTAGEFVWLPAVAEDMYHPEIFGRSEGRKFTVNAAEAVKEEEKE